jgi:hypothetical protein
MTDSDQFIVEPLKDEHTAQDETDREGAGAGTSSPSDGVSNADYTDERHNYSDRRTGIKATDCHYSWREVYASQHVRPGR